MKRSFSDPFGYFTKIEQEKLSKVVDDPFDRIK